MTCSPNPWKQPRQNKKTHQENYRPNDTLGNFAVEKAARSEERRVDKCAAHCPAEQRLAHPVRGLCDSGFFANLTPSRARRLNQTTKLEQRRSISRFCEKRHHNPNNCRNS